MFEFDSRNEFLLPHLQSKVHFNCQAGDGLVIFGENGVGKSSLINFFSKKYQSLFDLSIMSQMELDSFYDRTLEAFSFLVKTTLSVLFDLEKFQELWKIFALDKKQSFKLSHLSGGEMQSLKLVLALSKKAKIYFLDEPFHFLDLEKKNILIRLLEQLRFDQKVVIVIEHQLVFFDSSWKVLKIKKNDNILEIES